MPNLVNVEQLNMIINELKNSLNYELIISREAILEDADNTKLTIVIKQHQYYEA